MEILLAQFLLLLLTRGAQSLDCKVCENGEIVADRRVDTNIGNLLANICSGTESDNLAPCQGDEDVCVTYSTTYSLSLMVGPAMVETTSYRCGVEADLDGSNSAFCVEFAKEQESKVEGVYMTKQLKDFNCVVTSPKKVVKEDPGKVEEEVDCQTQICNAAEGPRMKLFLVCAAVPVIYGLI